MRRNTAAQQQIKEILEAESSALSQDMLEKKLGDKVDRVTIYRVLNRFCEDGIVHKTMSDEGKAYYALCRRCNEKHHKHEHAHFRCLKCLKVECLKAEIKMKLPEGYVAENVNYWISGYCNACNVA
jgi:Fur family transcriptional regulator, ferric uptake regulator